MPEILTNSSLIFWGSITLMATVPVIVHHWARVRKAEIEASLKHEMIQRGMSADEIVSVLEGKSRKKSEEKKAEPANTSPFRGQSERVWAKE
jgi:hypothetical protein